MSPQRRISLAFGALYLITFATSIPALWLFQPVLDDPQGYIAGGGADNRIYLGALLELILIIANIGTAIVLIPLLKRQHEILTFSYVAGSHHGMRLHCRRHPRRACSRDAAA
ncbi:MAG: DUF4386 family protein [Candidatus Limnocylindria bacterium]